MQHYKKITFKRWESVELLQHKLLFQIFYNVLNVATTKKQWVETFSTCGQAKPKKIDSDTSFHDVYRQLQKMQDYILMVLCHIKHDAPKREHWPQKGDNGVKKN